MTRDTPVVFLDTNVVTSYLGGDLPWLMDKAMTSHFTYAINPIVLQELILSLRQNTSDTGALENFLQKTDMLPLSEKLADDIGGRARTLRNLAVHANDILILGSASDCDYLLTTDDNFKALASGERPRIMTPDAFHRGIGILE